jgi:hypothetical protein
MCLDEKVAGSKGKSFPTKKSPSHPNFAMWPLRGNISWILFMKFHFRWQTIPCPMKLNFLWYFLENSKLMINIPRWTGLGSNTIRNNSHCHSLSSGIHKTLQQGFYIQNMHFISHTGQVLSNSLHRWIARESQHWGNFPRSLASKWQGWKEISGLNSSGAYAFPTSPSLRVTF